MNVGDKVMCYRSDETTPSLKAGKVYIIEFVHNFECIVLEGVRGYYSKHRFELIREGKNGNTDSDAERVSSASQ